MHVASIILIAVTLSATIYLVARFPGSGSVAAVILGWGVITFASLAWQSDEFTEGWSLLGWFPMIVWSFVVRRMMRYLKGVSKRLQARPG